MIPIALLKKFGNQEVSLCKVYINDDSGLSVDLYLFYGKVKLGHLYV